MADAVAWTPADAARVLSEPTDSDDKYSRGVVGLRTGSDAYPGAAVLGVEAAWRTGIGMVRYAGPERAGLLVLQRRPETVLGAGRAQCWVIGSGTDAAARAPEETAALRALLAGADPIVVDAGALDLAAGIAAPFVVTPHDREHARLRQLLGMPDAPAAPTGDAGRTASALETARALGGVVLLKGARTVVATPGGWCTVVAAGTPWLAAAGTGDVLAGAIGAVVAAAAARHPLGAEDLGPLAATGALLHGFAGRRAAAAAGGGPITALDVAEALPSTVAAVLRGDAAPGPR